MGEQRERISEKHLLPAPSVQRFQESGGNCGGIHPEATARLSLWPPSPVGAEKEILPAVSFGHLREARTTGATQTLGIVR